MFLKGYYSLFTIEKRKLKIGLKYVLREKRYGGLSAPCSIHDINVYNSLSEAESVLTELKSKARH